MNRIAYLFGASVFLSCSISIGTAVASTIVTGAARATPYEAVKEFLKQVTATYPQNVVPFDLGLSDSGDIIKGLKIGNGPIHDVVVGTHHGNEYGSTEVTKAVASSLAQDPIEGHTVYVIPVLNISGYNTNQRRETLNGTTYDANRDYPGPCGTEGPFKLKSTAALAKLIDQENIISSATLHTFSPAVVYPWGISTRDTATPYQDIFVNMVTAATQESHYQTGNSTDVIYPADGCYEDYAFWKHGIWSILFELGNSHTPSPNDQHECPWHQAHADRGPHNESGRPRFSWEVRQFSASL